MSFIPLALQEESRDAKYLHPCLMDSSVLNEFGGSPRLSLDCMTSVAVPPLSTCMMASRTFTYSEIPFSLAYFSKYQKLKQKYNGIQKTLDDMRKENHKLAEEKNIMQDVSDRYDRVVRVLGIETVDAAVQQDIRNEKALEEKQRMEQMPKGSIHERLAWGIKKSEMENQQRKKNKSKNREMER